MTPEYIIYLNGNYFDTLLNSTAFGDRPEPYRLQEKKLWTIYQLAKLGEHEVTVTAENRQVVIKTKSYKELKY
ncbi:hypothetical protein [Hymenobacter psoromatis]|nr:hypothetical protein [Hymenobacter psoromatis]